MNTYSLLLVDDEEEVTQVIERKIDWAKLGFCVIGHANNGLKALEMIEEFQPDVVMTDIRMPYMDGMQLCGEIKSRYPTTKILLFTGFDEFEYAKEAVHLEIEEYILKPLNAIELTEVFAKLKQKLDQEIDEKRNVETLQKYYMDSLPLLQANFYSTLIEGRIYEEQLEQYLKDYQIQFEAPVFGCIVIHTSTNRVPEGMNPQLLAISVERQAKEQLAPKWKAKCFAYLGNTVLIVQLMCIEFLAPLPPSELGQFVTNCWNYQNLIKEQKRRFPTEYYMEVPEQLILRKLFRKNRSTRKCQARENF